DTTQPALKPDIDTDLEVENLDLEKVGECQRSDQILNLVHEWYEIGTRPEWSDVAKHNVEMKYYWHRWDSLVVQHGVMYRKWENDYGTETELQMIVPRRLRNLILTQMHDSVTAGHLGVKKTLLRVRHRFFWYGLRRDVEKWCHKCEICAARKTPAKKPRAPMKQYNSGARWERIAIDFLGPLGKTENGNNYLMVVGCYFTKWTEAIPIKHLGAEHVARELIDKVFQRMGIPLLIHTDQGRTFESHLFQELCKLFGISKTRTTSGRPCSDGMIERANRTILNMLSAFVAEHPKRWDELIPFCMMAYRSSVHEATSVSPAAMTFGSEIRLPLDLLLGQPERQNPETDRKYGSEYVNDLEDKLLQIHEFARTKLNIASDAMKRNYDVKTSFTNYHEGDAVWYYNPQRKVGVCSKLMRPWTGPYKVITKLSNILFRIRESSRHKPRVVHHDRLKPFNGEVPSWFNSN
ncbi:MAG: integrase, partial [Sedimenticola sp.]